MNTQLQSVTVPVGTGNMEAINKLNEHKRAVEKILNIETVDGHPTSTKLD